MPTFNQYLKYRHIKAGMSLVEYEDLLFLCLGSYVIATFERISFNEKEVLDEADRYLEKIQGPQPGLKQ